MSHTTSRGRSMPLSRPLVVLVAVLGTLATWQARVARADELGVLKREFEVVARRVDERGWAKQEEILTAIADLETPQARRTLESYLDRWAERSWRRAGLVLRAFVRHGGPKDVDRAVRWVEDQDDPLLLEELGDALATTQSATARAHMRGDALRSAVPPVKAQIARALGLLRDREAVGALLLLPKDSDPRVRTEALFAVGLIGDPIALAPLTVFLKDEDPRIRDVAAQALGFLGDPAAAPALCRALDDEEPLVVESAALSLALLRDRDCVDHLIDRLEALYPADLRTADAIVEALERTTGQAFGMAADMWRDWWSVWKDKKVEPQPMPPHERTVPGLPYYGFRIRSSKVVFVIDASRSMGWNDRLEEAKKELILVLESLPETTSFNILVYSDGISAWQKEIKPSTKSYVAKAVKFVERLKPQNGTNTYEALQLALSDPEADTVFLLSDGSPSTGPVVDPDRILAEVRMWNRYRRVHIHVVALVRGDPPAAFAGREDERKAIEFMTRLAEKNDGECKVIR